MMECNRDEALKAREIAEKRFAAKDIIGAKIFAVKAQSLYPDLDGIGQMIATLDVHLSAEEITNGERDWYGILSVKNSAEDEMVKKQYRKLALMLHPDKNKSIGAESAFKLVSEAWGVLSDKRKRMMYDTKRGTQVGQQIFSQYYGSYGFCNFAKNAASNLRCHMTTAQRNGAPSTKMSSPNTSSKANTFWTLCNHCQMRFEYYRIYLNQNLLCRNCKKPFLAEESTNLTEGFKSSTHFSVESSHIKFTSCRKGSTTFHNIFNLGSFDRSNFQWGAFSRTAGAASAAASTTAAAQAANMVHQIYEKVKREREERQAAAKRTTSSVRKPHASKRTSNGMHIGSSHCSSDGSIFDRKNSILSDEDVPMKRRRTVSHVPSPCEIDGDKPRGGNTVSDFHSDSSDAGPCTVVSGDRGVYRDGVEEGKCIDREIPCINIQKMLMKSATSLLRKNLDDRMFVEVRKAESEKTGKEGRIKEKEISHSR